MAQQRHVHDARQWFYLAAQRLQTLFADDHHTGSTVTNLACRCGGNAAAFLQKFDRANALKRTVKADAFINRMHFVAGGTVSPPHLDGHDFTVKRATVNGCNRALVTIKRKLIELVTRQFVFLGDHLGAHELAELNVRIARLHLRAHVVAHAVLGGQRAADTHRHAGHTFNASSDYDIHGARHYRLRRKVNGLL